ncbi:hypothetical protein TruAng_007746 [Truncatella angustata]|nr:hypothetical protein TruAng_007746 [Truncatella angustata]
MHSTTRQTRSRTLLGLNISAEEPHKPEISYKAEQSSQTQAASLKQLPSNLKAHDTKLRKRDQALLKRKQQWLREYDLDIPQSFAKHKISVDATLVFAQEEAGTAVCISAEGLLLTCSHCVAESEQDLSENKTYWLLFRSGSVVAAKCIAWDEKRDLALLQITAAQLYLPTAKFPFALIHDAAPRVGARIVCVGHPGSEDLEASQPGIKTNYDVLHVSTGVYHGCAEEQDVQDNLEIGALMHDAWTYWGHSGAPLLCWKSGRIIGLHSSWDDQTGMRRGIALQAIQKFLALHGTATGTEETQECSATLAG